MYPAITASTSHQHPTPESPLVSLDPRLNTPPDPGPIDDSKPALSSSAKKSHARKQPEGHIPRPRNAFILFRSDFVAQKKIPASVEPDHRNISRIVGRIWKAMSDEGRQPWIEEAKRERERHKRLYPQYRYAPSSATSSGVGTASKDRRSPSQKVKETAGVLPPWEAAPQTTPCSSPQPTHEPQQGELPQAEIQSLPCVAAFDDLSSTSSVQDNEGSVASHATSGNEPFIYNSGWEQPCQFQPQHWSFPSVADPRYSTCFPNADVVTLEGLQSLETSSPSSQELTPFIFPPTSIHFDSPDPSPANSTQILPPFTFVTHHNAVTNQDFSEFSQASGECSVTTLSFDDLRGPAADPIPQYQQHIPDLKHNPENLLESYIWTTDQTNNHFHGMQNRSSFDYGSPQPNSFL